MWRLTRAHKLTLALLVVVVVAAAIIVARMPTTASTGTAGEKAKEQNTTALAVPTNSSSSASLVAVPQADGAFRPIYPHIALAFLLGISACLAFLAYTLTRIGSELSRLKPGGSSPAGAAQGWKLGDISVNQDPLQAERPVSNGAINNPSPIPALLRERQDDILLEVRELAKKIANIHEKLSELPRMNTKLEQLESFLTDPDTLSDDWARMKAQRHNNPQTAAHNARGGGSIKAQSPTHGMRLPANTEHMPSAPQWLLDLAQQCLEMPKSLEAARNFMRLTGISEIDVLKYDDRDPPTMILLRDGNGYWGIPNTTNWGHLEETTFFDAGGKVLPGSKVVSVIKLAFLQSGTGGFYLGSDSDVGRVTTSV